MAECDIEKGKAIDDNTSNINVKEGSIAEGVKNRITAKLRNDSPLPASCCIFRVPQVLRRQKKEAYTPDILSIGPFHRGRKQFKFMENVKHWYLQGLLSRRSNLSLDSLINGVLEYENTMQTHSINRARNCYADPLHHLGNNEFVEMLVVDGCFLLELFRKAGSVDLRDENDPIFNEACMLAYLYHDLLLLENQLPWFVLECLYDLTGKSTNTQSSSLVQLVLNYFRRSVGDDRIFSSDHVINPHSEVLHILDLARSVIVGPFNDHLESQKKKKKGENSSNLTTKESKRKAELPQRIPSATALTEVGVGFKKNPTTCILDINFNFNCRKGEFTIPTLVIDETTAPLFRNLIAYEQCYHSCRHTITSYAVLMDNLIDSNKDVDLLCEKGILANWLNAEDAAKFFNDIYNDTTVIGYCYQDLCNDVNKYHDDKWNKWMEKLRSDYFSTPWATISFIAAFILLVLTLLQTIFTIHPAK